MDTNSISIGLIGSAFDFNRVWISIRFSLYFNRKERRGALKGPLQAALSDDLNTYPALKLDKFPGPGLFYITRVTSFNIRGKRLPAFGQHGGYIGKGNVCKMLEPRAVRMYPLPLTAVCACLFICAAKLKLY